MEIEEVIVGANQPAYLPPRHPILVVYNDKTSQPDHNLSQADFSITTTHTNENRKYKPFEAVVVVASGEDDLT